MASTPVGSPLTGVGVSRSVVVPFPSCPRLLLPQHTTPAPAVSADDDAGLDLDTRLCEARAQLERVQSPAYLGELIGTIGADPMR